MNIGNPRLTNLPIFVVVTVDRDIHRMGMSNEMLEIHTWGILKS